MNKRTTYYKFYDYLNIKYKKDRINENLFRTIMFSNHPELNIENYCNDKFKYLDYLFINIICFMDINPNDCKYLYPILNKIINRFIDNDE